MKQAIVIPTHRSGIGFLDSLLTSFQGFSKYPILVVVNDSKPTDHKIFQDLRENFHKLPISIEYLGSNSFELGGIYVGHLRSDYDEIFLIPHACEIKSLELLDIVFEKYGGRSVALSIQTGNWNYSCGESKELEALVLSHLDKEIHQLLQRLGEIPFIPSLIGKFRREVLNRMNLHFYLPTNIIEAISKSELLFSRDYMRLDDGVVWLFPEFKDGKVFEQHRGKLRMKIQNEFILKWKSHWSPKMVFDEVAKQTGDGA